MSQEALTISRTAIALVLLVASAFGATGQREPPVDSLITLWLDRGTLFSTRWSPAHLFEGCPKLEGWQERGIRRLMAADLTAERTKDLEIAWARALQECHDPRLEQWYLDRVDEAIARGEWRYLIAQRMGLDGADSPRIRAYFWNQMLDTSLPENVRGTAGGLYFGKLRPEELRGEFLRAFATGRLPWSAWGLADRVLRQDPDRLLREVAPLVRANPMLANQSAFTLMVQVGYHEASDEARRELGDALAAGLAGAAAGMPERLRQRLESTVQDLRRPHIGTHACFGFWRSTWWPAASL